VIFTWVIIVALFSAFQWMTSRKSDELRNGLSSTQFSLGDLERRVQQGDTSAVAEIEAMRRRVEDFDRVLATQREQFRQLSQRADETKSRQAVEHAKVAVLHAEVTTSRDRLQKLKNLHASWTARQGSLLTGDPGKRIAGSPTHLDLVAGLLSRERPTDADLLKWEVQLESLSGPIQSASQKEQNDIAITPEHAQLLSDLGHQLTKAVVTYDQQNVLLEAVLRETSGSPPAEVTLESKLQQRQTDVERGLAQKLAKAREEARIQAEAAQAQRLAKLEEEIVAAAGKGQEDALLAKKLQAAQLANSELERIAEETRVKEAQKKAEIAGLKAEATRVDAALKAAALEREFERDLPEIKSLLSAFLTGGFKYRSTNDKGPASLSHIASQHGLESTYNGSYAMSFLANSSDRPAGGLKNPSSPERIRRAQDLLNKYGALMVEKKMLEP